jgi:hypothetical protein
MHVFTIISQKQSVSLGVWWERKAQYSRFRIAADADAAAVAAPGVSAEPVAMDMALQG